MKRILFVDDEAAVLAGLRRSLRSMRGEWDMEFTASGPDAVEALHSSPFDVVVTDMRMPGMDGVELLTVVKCEQPETVRIVLSGHTDPASTMRATGLAHQYLSKPTDPDELARAIMRATALEGMLADHRVMRAAKGLGALPALPTLYAEVAQELASDDPSLSRVAQIVARDPGMAAKVVQIVNSSFFGLRTRVTDPVRAVTMLGLDIVIGLILAGPFHDATGTAGEQSQWMSGLATATLARSIARAEGLDKQTADDAYLAGLLLDSGRTVIATSLPDDFSAIGADTGAHSVTEAERRLLGATHAEIGAFILGVWGLPSPVVQAVAFHHDPGASGEAEFGVLSATHAASAIVSAFNDHPTVLDEAHLAHVGKLERLSAWEDMYEPPEEMAS